MARSDCEYVRIAIFLFFIGFLFPMDANCFLCVSKTDSLQQSALEERYSGNDLDITVPGIEDNVSKRIFYQYNGIRENDLTGSFSFGGSGPYQNLIAIEGVPFTNPYRLRMILGDGLLLLSDAFFDDVRLHRHHSPLQYGNALGTVLSYRGLKESESDSRGTLSLDPLNASILINGKMPSHSGSWRIQGRRSMIDAVSSAFTESSGFPEAWDVQVGFTLNTKPTQTIQGFALISEEDADLLDHDFTFRMKEEATTRMLLLVWENGTDKRKESVKAAYQYQSLDYLLGVAEQDSVLNYKMQNVSFTLREDFTYQFHAQHRFNRGIMIHSYTSEAMLRPPSTSVAFGRKELSPAFVFDGMHYRIGGYAEIQSKWAGNIESRIGLRYDHSSLIESGTMCPRFALKWSLGKYVEIMGSVGKYAQFPNGLDVFSREWPINYQLLTPKIIPEEAWKYTLSLTCGHLPVLLFTLGGYYKHYNNLIIPNISNGYSPLNFFEGTAYGYGASVAGYILKDVFMSVRYSGLHANKYTDNYYKEPFKFDRRHQIFMQSRVRFLQCFNIQLSWKYGSGLPFLPVHGYLHGSSDGSSFIQDHRLVDRLPSYNRLDIQLTYSTLIFGKPFSVYVSLYNVTNHKNVYDYLWYSNEDSSSRGISSDVLIDRFTLQMMPLLPVAGIKYTFQE